MHDRKCYPAVPPTRPGSLPPPGLAAIVSVRAVFPLGAIAVALSYDCVRRFRVRSWPCGKDATAIAGCPSCGCRLGRCGHNPCRCHCIRARAVLLDIGRARVRKRSGGAVPSRLAAGRRGHCCSIACACRYATRPSPSGSLVFVGASHALDLHNSHYWDMIVMSIKERR